MLRAVEKPRGPRLDVDEVQLVTVVGHGHQGAIRRSGQVGDAAEVERVEAAAPGFSRNGRFAGLVDLDAVLAPLVAHHHHRGAVTHPGGEPVADAVGPAVLTDGLSSHSGMVKSFPLVSRAMEWPAGWRAKPER